MPPIKGRMLGLQSRMNSAGGSPPLQSTLDYKNVKNLGIPRKKSKFHGKRNLVKTATDISSDEKLQQLRIPSEICRILPSVKKFGGNSAFVDIADDDGDDVKMETGEGMTCGFKKGRGQVNKYHMKSVCERKFTGLIWDLEFLPDGSGLAVSCGDGVHICDMELNKKKTLENIRFAGGVGFLSDHKIVAICRFMDIINVYSPDGELLRSFSGGISPMTLAINSRDEILVADVGPDYKCINIYNSHGSLIRKIAQTGTGYSLKWPLYMSVLPDDCLAIADCHVQKVLIFDPIGRYVRTLSMKTFGGNEVLRPHGICTNELCDLFVVDNTLDTVEVFTAKGSYLQTLVPSDDGFLLRPKVLCSDARGHFAIGGLKGLVKLFSFIQEQKAVKEEKNQHIKHEVKDEPSDDVIVLDEVIELE